MNPQFDYDSFESEASFEHDSLNGSENCFNMGANGSTEETGESLENDDKIVDKDESSDGLIILDEDFAKLRASLSWILQKAYKNNIPSDFKDPFYEKDDGNWVLKPVIINALSSSELYCQACNNIFPEWKGHASVIQVLSRKGIYVTDSDDVAVTDTVLSKTAPFHVKGHLALIYGLMMAYAAETTNVELVVQAVRRFATFNASSELPTSAEDTAVFWLNKVCSAAQFKDTSAQQLLQGETNQKVRIVSRTPVKDGVHVPVIQNLCEDIGDGSSLAVVISFYCPQHLKYSDICLKENLGIADSLYNLRLVRTFCENHLPLSCFHFTYEDLLYSNNKMKENILAFIADLFYWFEINPASCVQRSTQNDQEMSDVKNGGTPSVSSATKKSFQKTADESRRSGQDINRTAPSPTFASTDRDSRDKALLANVSIDSEVHESFSDTYIDLGDLDKSMTPRQSRQPNVMDPSHPDYMEIESVTSNSSRSRVSVLPSNPNNHQEPLTPARLKTSKEKVSNHSKAEERGHGRKKVTSPTKPKKKSPFSSVSPAAEDMLVTPFPDDQLSWKSSESNGSGKKEPESFYMNSQVAEEGEVTASYTIPGQVHTLHSARAAGIPVVEGSEEFRRLVSREGSVTSSRSSGDFSDHESHKIHYDHKAREAVEMKNGDQSGSSTSSSQSKPAPILITEKLPPPNMTSIIDRSKKPHTTNFAEIKRLKETYGQVDNSGLVYMQHGQEASPTHSPLKSAFLNKQQDAAKKTSFAALPNETTWQQSAQRSSNQNQNNSRVEDIDSPSQPLATELMSLKMKLDEKRKEIERKKHRTELQHQRLRQRMGKAAFLQVVSKHLPDKDGSIQEEEPEPSHSQRLAADVRERLGQMSLPGQRSLLGESSPQTEPHRPTTLVDVPNPSGAAAASKNNFSRDDIQHTIDNVKKKWFKDDEMSTSSQSLPERRDSYPSRRDSREESRSLTQSPVPHKINAMEGSDHSSQGKGDHQSFEDYEGSLDRLNYSLTELQGEIARLSLQHEQIKSAKSPPDSQPSSVHHPQAAHTLPHPGHTSSRQSIPDRTYQSQTLPRSQWKVSETSRQPTGYTSSNLAAALEGLPDCYSQQDDFPSVAPPMLTEYNGGQTTRDTSLPRDLPADTAIDSPIGYDTPPRSTDGEEDANTTGENEGFFVSFGGETPKRSKPKLGKERLKRGKGRDESPAPATRKEPSPTVEPTPPQVEPTRPRADPTPVAPVVPVPNQVHDAPDGFVLADDVDSKEQQEMLLKREKLQQLQTRRLQEAEKKRLEKEAENARRKEKERLKQEEAEKKKAEEKLRRDQIFQQYLQKKKEKEDEQNGVVSRPAKTPAKTPRARPKSMFVRPKDDSSSKNSSQEDLSTSGESGVPPTSHPRPLRLPSRLPTTKMRKAVSCNTLNQNGQGGATYRRPPSPDLLRLNRGKSGKNFEDDLGAGSTTGPKLFVKPSQKSNRNLICNAISHCCLAGIVNNDVKNRVLEEINRSTAKHFVILFRDAGLQYRGVYTYEPETEEVFKLVGSGPRYINNKSLEKYFKYNSGSKCFSEITSTKHLSVSIDAIVPVSSVWKSCKPTGMRR
ncbi:calmodulin-regulated spectrin-associated protein 1 isoform X2 [Patella vulgata]|uniref:calmodulin-regulated spectrin-associated protein 1 isoform X2 n=1 Tax=Patella vulgata TaxID=6465 RepID=UPI00217FC6E2|nr:calmodulin-regulated spectrin-associated protein 1 isoform X2 [Patella vulgata]